MKQLAVGVVLVVLGTSSSAWAGDGREPGRLRIRIYDGVHMSAADLSQATSEAAAIVRAAVIEVVMVNCAPLDTQSAPDACAHPIGIDELVVRVTWSGPTATRFVSMGNSLVTVAGEATFATVFIDRVQAVARGAGVSEVQLLGRAIAHEIGHLLLNTNTHATTGLMRATWSVAELRRHRDDDWRFDAEEAERIRAAVVRRTGASYGYAADDRPALTARRAPKRRLPALIR